MKKRAKTLTAVEEKLVARDISPCFGIVAIALYVSPVL